MVRLGEVRDSLDRAGATPQTGLLSAWIPYCPATPPHRRSEKKRDWEPSSQFPAPREQPLKLLMGSVCRGSFQLDAGPVRALRPACRDPSTRTASHGCTADGPGQGARDASSTNAKPRYGSLLWPPIRDGFGGRSPRCRVARGQFCESSLWVLAVRCWQLSCWALEETEVRGSRIPPFLCSFRPNCS